MGHALREVLNDIDNREDLLNYMLLIRRCPFYSSNGVKRWRVLEEMLALIHGNHVVKKWGMQDLVILHVFSSGLHRNREVSTNEPLMAQFASSYIEQNAGSICQKIATIGNCAWTAFHLSISTLSESMARAWIDAPIPLGTKSSLVNSHSLSPKCESSLVVLHRELHHLSHIDDDDLWNKTYNITRLLVDEIPHVDVNVIDSDGVPLLICMLQCGAVSTVAELLRKIPNVDVNARSRNQGMTPLMFLTRFLDTEPYRDSALHVMRILSERANLDVNATDNSGRTALQHAIQYTDHDEEGCESGVIEMIDVFSSRLDANVRDTNGETVLLSSLKKGSIALALRLLDIPGIDIHAANRDGLNAPLLVMKSMAFDENDDEMRNVAKKMLSKLGI